MANGRRTNPIAVAMRARYGKTTSVHKDRRAPRGGQTNEQRGWMAEWEDEKEAREDERAEMVRSSA